MSMWSDRKSLIKRTLFISLALVTLTIIALAVWIAKLDHNIKERFAEKRFAPPIEFYSAPESVQAGMMFPEAFFESLFSRKNYRRRDYGQPLQPGDFSIWNAEQCGSLIAFMGGSAPETSSFTKCIAFRNRRLEAGAPVNSTPSDSSPTNPGPSDDANVTTPGSRGAVTDDVQIIGLANGGQVEAVFAGAHPALAERVEIEPEIFAQYYGDQPILRKVVALGETPPICLNALLAIEDSQFLEHPGISFTGLMRAFLANLRRGRVSQGGSTITQQLVKNYFLSDERTFKRKITEIVMSFLVEQRATKDEILETYINLIYMGQNGPFQVRGFAAAADHYFGRQLADLKLEDCALTAAIVNSPGLFDPFKHPENALKRRARVLDRMTELGMITAAESSTAKQAPLPQRPERALTEPAPYFVQAVRRSLAERGFDESEGLRVFTTLDLRAQEAAQQSIRSGLDRLEKNYAQIRKLKEQGKNLEAVLLAADPKTGAVQALVGGRGFKATQFNRAIDGHRQVGSVMKPFVYLTALESNTDEGELFSPITIVKDQAVTHRFEGQNWTPHNYEGTYRGDIPLFFALKESLNASTASLGIKVGLSKIIDNARAMGVTSNIKALPSLTLGAFELTPMEVLQAYSTLARLGEKAPLTMIRRVETLTGETKYEYNEKAEQVVPREATAELVGIMKQVLISGTARSARLNGFTHPAAGKTGTTNDKKDAWFSGFTPYHTAIVWVGYDDNTSHNLTGGSGAVPIWTEYMKSYATRYPPDDFQWPDTVEKATLPSDLLTALGVPGKKDTPPEPVELIFRKGQAPPNTVATPEPVYDPTAAPTPNEFKPAGI